MAKNKKLTKPHNKIVKNYIWIIMKADNIKMYIF